MGVLTDKELEKVLDDQGLRHRIRRFYEFLCGHGLQRMTVPRYLFVEHFEQNILKDFFVKGIKEHPDGRQEYPARQQAGAPTGETSGAGEPDGD